MQTIQLDIADDKLDTFLSNDVPLSQDEYDSEMKDFMKTL